MYLLQKCYRNIFDNVKCIEKKNTKSDEEFYGVGQDSFYYLECLSDLVSDIFNNVFTSINRDSFNRQCHRFCKRNCVCLALQSRSTCLSSSYIRRPDYISLIGLIGAEILYNEVSYLIVYMQSL